MRSDSPRRSASPPTSCSMLSARISRAKASSTGRKPRFETGSVTDGGSKTGSGAGPRASSSGLMSGTTASVGASKGFASVMLDSQESFGYGIRGEVRASPQLSPIDGCGHGFAEAPLAAQACLVSAFVTEYYYTTFLCFLPAIWFNNYRRVEYVRTPTVDRLVRSPSNNRRRTVPVGDRRTRTAFLQPLTRPVEARFGPRRRHRRATFRGAVHRATAASIQSRPSRYPPAQRRRETPGRW